jgi:hypothetical protein
LLKGGGLERLHSQADIEGVLQARLRRISNAVTVPPGGSVRFVFRPLSIIGTELCVAFITSAVFGGVAILGTAQNAPIPEPWDSFLIVVWLPTIPLSMYRALRISVVADAHGLTVKNYWRTHVLRWADIKEVRGAIETVGVLPTAVLAFDTSNKKVVKVIATATTDKHKRALVRQLKACPELTAVPFELPPHLLA